MEFFLNKEKDQVMKTKEKLCQKQLVRNLLLHMFSNISTSTRIYSGIDKWNSSWKWLGTK